MKSLFKFNPNKEILILTLLWMSVVFTIYTAFIIFTTDLVALNFITFCVVGISILGIGIPVIYHTLYKKRSFKEIGITKDKLLITIILTIAFSTIQYFLTIHNLTTLPETKVIIPLISMSLVVGLFENLFFRGFIQLRMEKAFGIIPGILISSIMYALYHIGYGMTFDEMFVLLIIGLIYSTIFKLTNNIFVLLPLLTPMGAIYTHIKEGLEIPFESTYGFTIVLIFIIVMLTIINKKSKQIIKEQIK